MRKVKDLSEKLVTKVFTDRKSQYTIFKSFDTDGDGFVSYNDFIKRVERLEIDGATKESALALAKFLDPDKNGYIEFKDFTKGF
jgi:Ca2+-binding EF-hand superfamily protein